MRKKIGLALGSGGARGFCHLGIIEVFEKNGIPIDYISGCSMGALLGGCYSAGVDVEHMLEIIKKLNQRMILDIDITLKKQGILKGNKAMSFVKKLIGDKTFDDCVIPFAATAVNILSGELRVIREGSLAQAIRASISIPAAFQYATNEHGERLVDGGVMERIPINACRELGADFVIAVDALGEPQNRTEMKGIFSMIEQTYLLMDWEASKHKIKSADFLITPNQAERSMYLFNNNLESYEAGVIAAENALENLLSALND